METRRVKCVLLEMDEKESGKKEDLLSSIFRMLTILSLSYLKTSINTLFFTGKWGTLGSILVKY